MKLRQSLKRHYDFILKSAGTLLARRLMLIYSALESIIIPIPVDPLLAAVVLAQPQHWLRRALECTAASVFGGALGWAMGAFMGPHLYEFLNDLDFSIAPASVFESVEKGFDEFGLILVFLGAFSPLPYKVMALSAGIGGFGLIPFLIISFIGRGLRFGIIAAIAKNHSDAKKLIGLISLLILLFLGAIWLTK